MGLMLDYNHVVILVIPYVFADVMNCASTIETISWISAMVNVAHSAVGRISCRETTLRGDDYS